MILEGTESQAWEKASLYMEDVALALDIPARQFCSANQPGVLYSIVRET